MSPKTFGSFSRNLQYVVILVFISICLTASTELDECVAPNYFHCETDKCMSIVLKCDGHDDCGDNSDEEGCSTVVGPLSNSDDSEMSTRSTGIPAVDGAPLKPETPVVANSPTAKTENLDPFTAYMNGITNPLREDDAEYALDYYSEKALLNEYKFDSNALLKLLINSAMSQKTTPAKFLEEIQALISLQNHPTVENSDSSEGQDEVPKLPPKFLSLNDNQMKSMIDGREDELKRLEKKYNISTECTGPDSITATRLALMFPHYINFGQKPFAVPLEISVTNDSPTPRNIYDDVDDEYGYNRIISYEVPAIFERQEFGGLIPQSELDTSTRKYLISVHLYALHRKDTNDMVPFRTKCILLKWRIEKCALSDERRMRFLRNNDIINEEGQLLKTSINSAHDNVIPSDFKKKIDWALLGVPSLAEIL